MKKVVLAASCFLVLFPVSASGEFSLGKTEGVEWKLDLSLRARQEYEDWAGRAGTETEGRFGHVKSQIGILGEHNHFKSYVQGQIFQLYGLDNNIAGGPDLNYYTTNNNDSSPGSVSLRQAWLTLRDEKKDSIELTIGRFLYSSGLETPAEGPEMHWLKTQRISQRMIGPFDFTGGRSFDGARLDFGDRDTSGRFTGLASHPTQGGFEANNGQTIHEISVGSAVWSLPLDRESRDAQLFAYHYFDRRNVAKPDNRALEIRNADGEAIEIATFGGHFINVHDLNSSVSLDSVFWGAYQTGDWGTLSHSAYSFDAEFGVKWKEIAWKPWLRAGYTFASGDNDNSDGRHETFFRMVPTLRLYALTPAYAQQNIQETFIQFIVQPIDPLRVRSSLHLLHLAEGKDLQYFGSGAAERGSRFGVGGNDFGGSTDIGKLLDIEATYSYSKEIAVTAYLGHLFGGDGFDKSLGSDSDSSVTYGFLELNLRL